jgi:2',3'-cyclic-nucleotide 2'-phosphodiesterase (5'-nucleotidase family)
VEATTHRDASSLMVVHDRSDTAVIIDLHLQRTGEGIARQFKTETIRLEAIEPAPDIKKATHSFLSELERFLLVPIGTTETRIDTRKFKVRTGENGFGNFIADSLRTFFKADIALMNGGGIRGNKIYPPGTVLTRGDMLREIPFRNHAVRIEVTGRQLKEALENGFSRIEDKKGRFPHVSGMTVKYNPAAAPLNRVRSILVGDRAIDPERTYSLATVNFLASGGDGYTVFKDCPRSDKYGSSRLLWEYVRDCIADSKRISPAVEGRLIKVAD